MMMLNLLTYLVGFLSFVSLMSVHFSHPLLSGVERGPLLLGIVAKGELNRREISETERRRYLLFAQPLAEIFALENVGE